VERLKDALASNDAPVETRQDEAIPPESASAGMAAVAPASTEAARVDIAPFLERVVALHAPLALRHGVTCRVVAPAAPLAVTANADGLTKIMTNLVSNALKFSEPGAEVVVAATAAGPRVLIEVSDSGRGIPPELHERIFTPNVLSAGSRAATRERGGRGLAGTKSLVEAMHGTIDFTSAVGVGTTFWIDLPLAEAPATTLAP
jgi:signal transduction histidine kinase